MWWFKSQEVSKRGIPDIIGVSGGGRFFAIELKKDGSCRPDPLQEYTLGKIRRAGGIGFDLNPDMDWRLVLETSGIVSSNEKRYRRGKDGKLGIC